MPATVLTRVLLLVEANDARDLVGVLAAIASTAPPPWSPHTGGDGTDSESTTVTIGGTRIEVAVGEPAAPALIELRTERNLEVVLDEVVAVHGSATSEPSDPDARIEAVTAHVGKVAVVVRGRAAPTGHDLDSSPSSEAELRSFLFDRLASAERPGADYAYWRRSLIDAHQIKATIDLAVAQLKALVPPSPRGLSSHVAVRLGIARLVAEVEAEIEEAQREQ
ncbi:hypothetical protein [Tsukamurella pseudospumae]|uniref:Uncharacterized protein n=1 Tax=Tsukamurella pseudospumae TaxID=239498 RepID=A0A138AE88_9ACTN|nr:hypothetical protein [Tsukamurella pseudospumae]KXP08821.1 hypothetical protein AXK60_09155 [Tsukamurella pseudospumae]